MSSLRRKWLMKRNCSFTPKQVGAFYLSLVIFSFLIGGFFLLRGAWLIFPFTLLELLIVGIALYVYTRHANDYELIELHDDHLLIEVMWGQKKQEWRWNPAWVRVGMSESKEAKIKDLMTLTIGTQIVYLGKFISLAQRELLRSEVRQTLSFFR